MTLAFDHAVIAVRHLRAAMADYAALGFTVVRGGVHANGATENALIAFANGTYLELLAGTGAPPLPDLVDFSPMLAHGEGLRGAALRAADLESELSRLAALGFSVGAITSGERRRSDDTLVQWRLALLENSFAPFLIQDVTPQQWRIPADPALTTHQNGARGVHQIAMSVPAEMQARFHAGFGAAGVMIAAAPTPEVTLMALHVAGIGALDLSKTHGVLFHPNGG